MARKTIAALAGIPLLFLGACSSDEETEVPETTTSTTQTPTPTPSTIFPAPPLEEYDEVDPTTDTYVYEHATSTRSPEEVEEWEPYYQHDEGACGDTYRDLYPRLCVEAERAAAERAAAGN